MRKIFILLIGCTLLLSCSKDEKTQEEKERDIFNILIGKWQFSRMAWDIEFKEILTDEEFIEIVEVPLEDCDKNNYIEFFPDLSLLNKYGCGSKEDIYGYFEITHDREGPVLHVSGEGGLIISSHFSYGGYLSIPITTENIFVIHYANEYIEFKRID